jgi:hypothetical protein
MVAQAQFSTSDVMVQPGHAETLTMVLYNLSNHTETFTLVPSGLVAGWVRLSPPTVTLFGGTSETIEVTLKPPRLATTPAGPAPLTVRVIPQEEPDDVIIAETTVVIGAFHDRRVHLLQPVVRSRRRATYEFLVENQGNSQASCRLHLIDTSRRLDGDFDPPAVGIEPGGTSLVRLRMKTVRRQWRRSSRTLPFAIEADQQGFPTAVANANFVQTPVVPEHIGRRLAAVIVLGGLLAGAWFGLIKPATRKAAKDAVRDFTPAVVTTLPGTPISAPVTVVDEPAATTTTAPDAGTLFNDRLSVEIGPNESKSAQYQVPGGKELRITDLVLQNVNADKGLATISKNDSIIAQWDLDRGLYNNDPLQFVSAFVFEAGSTMTFTLACDAPGSVTGQCSEGLLVIGKLVDSQTG